MASSSVPDLAGSTAIKYLQFSPDRYDIQELCPLFTTIPGEIRSVILQYALADYEDTSQSYAQETCYRRPDYFAPRRSDTALLRTCQRIYREAWFVPWASREHAFYLTAEDRRPGHVITAARMQPSLDLLHAMHAGDDPISIAHARVFAQLYMLEPGVRLAEILTLRHFHPRRITLTIRHTDWWMWEQDDPLHIDARWVNGCRFPASVREFRVELESLERKRAQVDDMAQQMAAKWTFQRADGVALRAGTTAADSPVVQWRGSSTWNNARWIRDETSTPEMLEYYVRTVTWRAPLGAPSKTAPPVTPAPGLDVSSSRGNDSMMISQTPPCLPVQLLNSAGVPAGTTATEALVLVGVYEAARREEGRARRTARMAATREARALRAAAAAQRALGEDEAGGQA